MRSTDKIYSKEENKISQQQNKTGKSSIYSGKIALLATLKADSKYLTHDKIHWTKMEGRHF